MIKTCETNIDVLTAARQRIINLFSNGAKVYLSMSGGKDSIVMADITYNLIKEGKIDKSLLTVVFIDEECMYDDVIEGVKQWRKKFLLIGVPFEWYCLEVKHFNCVSRLQDDESFIVYDRYCKENWIQQPPPFAITSHPLHTPRTENYQQFLEKRTKDGFQMIGMRTAESVQRLINIGHLDFKKISAGRRFYPIYDWKDADIWFYLHKNKIDIPVTYLRMYQVGVSRRNLRICNFFAIDTMRCLVRMSEYDPQLMERVEKRQPNSYLAALYFDSEFFGRNSKARTKAEKDEDLANTDYRQVFLSYLNDDSNFPIAHQKKVQKWYKNRVISLLKFDVTNKEWKKLYEALKAGDTKLRNGRAITRGIKGRCKQEACKE